MASSYVNDLRLNEMATGDASGTWGTTTNTNLELIGEALGYGTEGITTNANTHTTTVADGATDPGRAMYLEYTGTLDSACTITIAPNTVSRMHFIENGTSGSQNIIIKQGSGATITIPPGDTKAVYLDGAGSGAAVVDAFASLNVVDLKVQDDLTVTDDVAIGGLATVGGTLAVTGIVTLTDDLIIGDGKTIGSASDVDAMTIASNGQITLTQTLIGTALDISGDIDVDGTSNLDIVDIDGAVDMASTLQVDGVATFTGRDIHSGGITIANAGQIGSVGDTDAIAIASDGVVTLTQKLVGTELDISGNVDVDGTTNLDVVDIDGAVDMASTLTVAGALTAQKLTSNNGILELDDNGSHNGIINVPASISINIDSDNGGTTETFTISKNKTAINDTDPLFRVQEDGKVGIGLASPQYNLSIFGSGNTFLNFTQSGDSVAGHLIGRANSKDLRIQNSEAATIQFMTSNTERMRILSDGRVAINTSGATQSARLSIQGDTAATGSNTDAYGSQQFAQSIRVTANGSNDTESACFLGMNVTSGATNRPAFQRCYDNETLKFQIANNGSVANGSGSYGTISDRNLKQNIVDANSQWDDIKAIQVRYYRFIDEVKEKGDDAITFLGVVAQELEEAGMTGLVDSKENQPKTVKTSIIFMKALKALQEAQTKIETLESKVAALESA